MYKPEKRKNSDPGVTYEEEPRETAWFSHQICQIACSFRVQMLGIYYKVECQTVSILPDVHRQNFYLTIKRNFYDQSVSDLKNYLPRMLILVNKQGKPMLYFSKEYHAKNIYYGLHRIKNDTYYPWVTLRIILPRPRKGIQTMIVQILDFVEAALPQDRMIYLKKLSVNSTLNIQVPVE